MPPPSGPARYCRLSTRRSASCSASARVADVDQPVRVLQALDVADDDVGLRVVDEVVDEIERAHADLVAGRHHLAEMQPAVLRREVHHRETEAAALRHHADAAGIVVGAENRAEARVDAVGEIDHALAVRADDADVEFRRDRRELALHRDALAADLGKAGAEDDRVRHAALAALRAACRRRATR